VSEPSAPSAEGISVAFAPGAEGSSRHSGDVLDVIGDGHLGTRAGEVAPPPQPGINGVRYGAKTGYLYYTSTAQKVFMRVPVDPTTLDPAGAPEFVAAIDNADDFCVDEDAGFAYVTRHRANTLDRVPLAPAHGSEVRHLAGDPFDPVIAGPSSAYWGREPGDHGRVLYVTTDGGRTAPPEGIVRNAALLRVELDPPAES
jgi:hypothetical protein